jgi:alanyl-tRNA synthetase
MSVPSTLRLYYDDPTLLQFDARVLACEPHAGAYRVALDRSAFYPTSGGQLHDLGHLVIDGRTVPVVEATVDDDEQTVWHRVAAPLAPEAAVTGIVDRERRQDFRQQHSGQHVLSAAFDSLIDAHTVSVHLGLDACTLDLHREVTSDECRRAEDLANTVVWENRPVVVRYADASELAAEPRLRRQTTRTGRVRLVDIADHDLSACGGTHVLRTGEVGIIVIRATERFRGGTRVTFLCGRRALASVRTLRDVVDASARSLSIGPEAVPDAIARLREDLKAEQRRARELTERLVTLEVEALSARASATGGVVAHLPDADAQGVRLAASQLVAVPGRVVALLGGASPSALVVARSADRTDVDAGAIVKQVCATYGGKGGGRLDLAQAGGVAVSVEQLRGFFS